ncbi:MAG TPA: Asp-tRNA(Asn)/Glu-tRNA(Gln) amidotransferase subunit GatC [bacterium]|nr:Asp-tRNA(Asn)/Glu-tRNA(Gln) amidotransferase subunit GatC [bacterium]HQL63007.1 Asp-tRNA(Asn)/Glu-tRNA(Gln) amidotransferase subunit GatC [bacterium]
MPETRSSERIEISLQQLRDIAFLSRLEVPDESLEELRSDFLALLNHFKQIDELPTDGVEPMAHPLELSNVFLQEGVRCPAEPDELLQNALEVDSERRVIVPRVVE